MIGNAPIKNSWSCQCKCPKSLNLARFPPSFIARAAVCAGGRLSDAGREGRCVQVMIRSTGKWITCIWRQGMRGEERDHSWGRIIGSTIKFFLSLPGKVPASACACARACACVCVRARARARACSAWWGGWGGGGWGVCVWWWCGVGSGGGGVRAAERLIPQREKEKSSRRL